MKTLSYRSRNIAKDPEAVWGTTTRIDEALNHIAMELIGWFIFLSAVLVGSYIQAVVGFALAMVMMAIGGATGTITLPVLTAASSIIAFVQVVFALKGQSSFVHRSIFSWMIAGQIPAIGIGVWFLTVLDRDAQWFLQMLLGIFIIVGSSSMMIRPYPRHKVSTQRACLIAGIGGGLIGGMFSASGPIIGWFAYRQPLDLVVIRATMLAFFAVATFLRTTIVAVQGGITSEVLWLSVTSLPFVLIGVWLGRTFPPPVSDTLLKRGVFFVLLLMGLHIVITTL